MKYCCQKWVINTVVRNYCFKYWTMHLESGLKFRNANTKCFSSLLSTSRHLKTTWWAPACRAMQPYWWFSSLWFTGYALVRTFWEEREEKGWKTAVYVEDLRTEAISSDAFNSNWCDSFSVPLIIFYMIILIKYLQTAPPSIYDE